jgi:hypothetical protein
LVAQVRFIDRPFAFSLSTFGVGALTGFLVAVLVPAFRDTMIEMLQVRVLEPVRGAMILGGLAVVILIFANNAVPVLLSFLYPILLARIHWTPPLTRSRRGLLLTGYSLLAAYLVGFFDLGASLGSILFERGGSVVISLLRHSWLHGPIEFTLILLCIAEPARIAARGGNGSRITSFDREDGVLLLGSLIGLLAAAMLEYALNI